MTITYGFHKKERVSLKKVGILTWYKTVNHGAVLQAYSTLNVLKSISCNPIMLDYTRNVKRVSSSRRKITLKNFIDHFIVKVFNKKKNVLFNNFIRDYLIVGDFYDKESNLDSVIVGSDMVFEYIQGYNPFMYGKDVNCNNIFSYAASFGKHSPQEVSESEHSEEITKLLLDMKNIGCRDENTYEIVRALTGREDMTMNIDPVLLYGFEKEKETWNTIRPKKKYIALYAYHSTMNNPEEYKYIKAYAKSNGYEIISVGYYHSWVDRCINAGPKEFFSLLLNAECVITDTFHGTVFSIILNKPFISYIRENGFKVRYLLQQLKMEDRIVENNKESLSEKIINCKFEVCNSILEDLRGKSLEYIKKCL